MGTIADSLFAVLMSWVRALVNAFWALFSSENTTILEFLGRNWIMIAVVLVAAGLVIDWAVWLIRWQPYQLWAIRLRRLLRLPEPEEEEEEADEDDEEALRSRREELYGASARQDDMRRYAPVREPMPYAEDVYGEDEPEDAGAAEEDWMPLAPVFDEAETELVMQAAQDVPDDELIAYPGMRYGAQHREDAGDGSTQRYAAIHSEGPGAAEVARRREEIDAWKRQTQEEANQRRQAERAAREQERLEREAREAEQARLAQAEREAEQARLAQEEYERQLAEYERQMAQYERDLAEYEREKAAYEAAQAEEAAREAAKRAEAEFAQEFYAQPGRQRRRRAVSASYSDIVRAEDVKELPPPPEWPKMTPSAARMQEAPKETAQEKDGQKDKSGLLQKMAWMVEPEKEEVSRLPSLPPRVDMKDAYMPARKPHKPGRRSR